MCTVEKEHFRISLELSDINEKMKDMNLEVILVNNRKKELDDRIRALSERKRYLQAKVQRFLTVCKKRFSPDRYSPSHRVLGSSYAPGYVPAGYLRNDSCRRNILSDLQKKNDDDDDDDALLVAAANSMEGDWKNKNKKQKPNEAEGNY